MQLWKSGLYETRHVLVVAIVICRIHVRVLPCAVVHFLLFFYEDSFSKDAANQTPKYPHFRGCLCGPRNLHRWPPTSKANRLRFGLHTLALLGRHTCQRSYKGTRQQLTRRGPVCSNFSPNQTKPHICRVAKPLERTLTPHSLSRTDGANLSHSTQQSRP